MPQSNQVRLQKFMAECGVASRRACEAIILSGRVKVNGRISGQLGAKIDPSKDKVMVDDKPIAHKEKKIYLKLNKPPGYISSCKGYGEKTIMDLLKGIPYRLYPIGRLDKDSEGLMILTNDGEVALRLTHPRYEHEKEYLVKTLLPITNEQLKKMGEGIMIEEGQTRPAKAWREADTVLGIILKEGKKRQIRKMVEAAGNRVLGLKRIRIAGIKLGKLPRGEYDYLNGEEIRILNSLMV